MCLCFFFKDTATTEIYTYCHTLSLHCALPIFDNLLREAHAIANPVMLHVATADHFVAPDVQKAMHEGLDNHPKVTIHDYSGLDHGFAAEFGKRRDEEGAQLDRKSVVSGTRVSVSVDLGGRRFIKKTRHSIITHITITIIP